MGGGIIQLYVYNCRKESLEEIILEKEIDSENLDNFFNFCSTILINLLIYYH